MCEKVSVVKAQKTRLLKKNKEDLVDLYFEEKRLKRKSTKEVEYLLDSLRETEQKLKDEKASKFKYIIALASSLVIIFILICILGL